MTSRQYEEGKNKLIYDDIRACEKTSGNSETLQ